MESGSSQDEDKKRIPENTTRRTGMRFSTIEDFLASLNTATTAVRGLQGVQKISVENYQKCMQGAESEDDAASQLNGKKLDDVDIKINDSNTFE